MLKIEKIRHSAAHVLAQAVKELWPDVKLGIGPVIEDGFYYDFDKKEPFKVSDLKKIEKKMEEIINKGLKFKKFKVCKREARRILKGEKYKLELLRDLKDDVTFYQQGDFVDLCKGPHVKNTKEIKAFKLVKISGAYWKGESRNKMLQRIYGVAFENKRKLEEYLRVRKEAEKRNHIKLGRELDLFSIHKEGPGFVFWHSNGMVIINELIKFWREEHKKAGYKEINTPIILSRRLWEQSGHWEHYKENMYFTKIDNKDYAIKPMNCPGCILVYKEKIHSYREFPLRIAELGLVHRHELSGVLSGLFRVRAFTQDDAHIFLTQEQIKDEVINVIKMVDRFYKVFKLKYHVELSTKPERYIGDDKMWDVAENALKGALRASKVKYKLNPGEGAFYGPKIDFHIEDCLKRSWQCATIQLDFAMPGKFKLSYEGRDGKKHVPVMLHRVIYGAIERFVGILVEHYAGKFPLWLSPVQVVLITVADRNVSYAKKLKKRLEEVSVRVELDDRKESVSKKVRDNQVRKVNFIVTIGDKEMKTGNLAVRTRSGKVYNIKVEDFIRKLLQDIERRC